MKTMYKVIVAMMFMAITTAPAIAANNVDKNARPDKKEMRMTDRKNDKKVDKYHNRHMAAIEVISFKVNHKASKKKAHDVPAALTQFDAVGRQVELVGGNIGELLV